LNLRHHLIHAALTAALISPFAVHAMDRAKELPYSLSIDCATPYPDTLAESIEAANLRPDPSHATKLDEMLESFSISELTSLKDPAAIETFDLLALLTHNGLMITSEIVHLEALDTQVAWRESRQSALFTRMLQTIYEPYHPDETDSQGASHGHDDKGGHDDEGEFNDALTIARNQVIEASRRIPGFFDRPVRWHIQGVVYNDPVARQFAAGRICADDALKARVPMINAEVSKIAPENTQ